jgi:hypothetical protein
MAYAPEFSRSNPTCFLFLVDQSGSMAQPFGSESSKTKSQGLADAINRLLQTPVHRCSKGDYVLDRYYIGLYWKTDEPSRGRSRPRQQQHQPRITADTRFSTVLLRDGDSFHFRTQYRYRVPRGDFQVDFAPELFGLSPRFVANNFHQGGLVDVGDIGDQTLDKVTPPETDCNSSVPAIVGHTYVSRAPGRRRALQRFPSKEG